MRSPRPPQPNATSRERNRKAIARMHESAWKLKQRSSTKDSVSDDIPPLPPPSLSSPTNVLIWRKSSRCLHARNVHYSISGYRVNSLLLHVVWANVLHCRVRGAGRKESRKVGDGVNVHISSGLPWNRFDTRSHSPV